MQTPGGEPFWSIGLNHVDSATLRYAENGNLWHDEFGNSMERWLATVRTDMQAWGFNTLGWNQELVEVSNYNSPHSRSFTFEEYQWLGMPYCHMLPFIESHQWESATRLPDIRSTEFADWCDYVARDQCGRMRDDPKLIGYWFTDCPTWVHHSKNTAWKAPLFDPSDLKTAAGRRELSNIATTYYRVTTEAIRRYDPHHLILGDRYEAMRPLPDEVVQAAMPFVDVLAFQCFGEAPVVSEKLSYWANLTGKPLLLADNAVWHPTAHRGWPPQEDRHLHPEKYATLHDVLRAMPECVGFHLCGAYARNRVRRYGLKDEKNQLDPSTAGITKVNHATQRWADSTSRD
ncbi:MAG: agarase [Synoicihabitans sp.]